MSNVYREIGHRIQAYRKACLYTQVKLARMLYRTQCTVSRWEKGTQRISVPDLIAVAEALDVPVADLIPQRQRSEMRVA